MSVCCGGILGLGETTEDRLKMLEVISGFNPQPESVPINSLKATATERLVDKVAADDGLEFAERLLKMPENELTELLGTLDDFNPGAARALRSRMFYELVNKRSTPDPETGGATARVDTSGLMRDITNLPLNKLNSLINTGMSKADASRLRSGVTALQKMAEGPQAQSAGTGLRARLENFAINAASQDVGFISRLLAGEFSPGFFERMIYTPEGQRALMHMGDPKVAAPLFAQSVNFAVNAMRAADEQRERLQQDVEERRAQQLGRQAVQGL